MNYEAGEHHIIHDDLSERCGVLGEKLDLLLRALHQESLVTAAVPPSTPPLAPEEDSIVEEVRIPCHLRLCKAIQLNSTRIHCNPSTK